MKELAARRLKTIGTAKSVVKTVNDLWNVVWWHIKKYAFPVLRMVVLVALAYQLLYPLLYMFSMAIRSPEAAADPSVVWIPKRATAQNFIDVIRVMDFGRVMATSVTIGIGCSLLDVVICSLTGYGFARFRFRGCNLLFMLVILTLIVPPQTLMLALYSMMRFFNAFGLMELLSKFLPIPEQINLIGNPITFFYPLCWARAIVRGYTSLCFASRSGKCPAPWRRPPISTVPDRCAPFYRLCCPICAT